MSETNKSLRIRTEIGKDVNLNVQLDQDYNSFEILSLKLTQEDAYRLQTVNYGVVVGRVLANDGFGIPNAKISIFIEADQETISNVVLNQLYPYSSTRDTDGDGTRYNLLLDKDVSECHRAVGTFPHKTYLLDNDVLLEIFDKYYKYTTRTNNSGDYILCGIPTGTQTLHMDLDLSDCGILSQRPRDFLYKGYSLEQFENPNQFKTSENLDSLSQIVTQDQMINVIPFWGNTNQGETVGITRSDIKVSFKFEPTCVFMGSVVSDNASNGVSKRCIPTNTMGAMDELVTGEGTIEMIRKTVDGGVEEYQIKGTELINSDGVWCYQIPMNLDYMMTDEYGNMVPTDNPDKGIPTRTSVRFRISLHDMEENTDNYFLSKVLVPNNPQSTTEVDYNFGSATKDTSYRDLFWNNVYTIKSFIPRFQNSQNYKNERFTGIKHCNIYGNNNPIPYNNIRIRLPLMFTILCALIKSYIRIVDFVNRVINFIARAFKSLADAGLTGNKVERRIGGSLTAFTYVVLADGLCPDLDGWYFCPNADGPYGENIHVKQGEDYPFDIFAQTFSEIKKGNETDKTSIDVNNKDDKEGICLTMKVDYLESCIEMNLAQEYRVINFDFYNDWINGLVYLPRWVKFVTKKRDYFWGKIEIPAKIKGCLSSANGSNNSKSFGRTRRYTQQCALSYSLSNSTTPTINSANGCKKDNENKQKCHKKPGFKQFKIFGKNGGFIQERITSKQQYVYYAKPCEWDDGKKCNLFATDLVLLGSLNDCNLYGIPQAFKKLSSSTYKMPTNLALTNMDDEGYMYNMSGNNGTICSVQTTSSSVSILTGTSLTYGNTKKHYSTDGESNFEYSDLDEYVALTEAAGIAWNYTGPGQGEEDNKSGNYNPGGHFLGLSCKNSMTNVKSCTNLERICEAGVTISQRNETISAISADTYGNNYFSYKHYVPTGLISKNEVVDEDFRTMFATLNQKRLIATATDPSSGYKIYDFSYKRISAFDGSMRDKIGSKYNDSNMGRYVVDELTSLGLSQSSDYEDLKNNTVTKTIESSNIDYYRFRLGIENLSSQYNKYLKNDDGYSLPVYENSYYFYFGLHAGATALDELNKQYFANCETETVDDSGWKYKRVATPTTTVVEMDEVPEKPSKDYPQSILVGETNYELTAIEEFD